jgi:hypothetical protein
MGGYRTAREHRPSRKNDLIKRNSQMAGDTKAQGPVDRNWHTRACSRKSTLALMIALLSSLIRVGDARAQYNEGSAVPQGASPIFGTRLQEWRFDLGTFVWAPAVKGDVTVEGQRIPIDADVPEIVKDSDFLFAFNLAFEARKGPWGLLASARFMEVGSNSGEPLMLNVTARIAIGETSGVYTFVQKRFRGSYASWAALDAVFGARLWWLGVQVKDASGLVSGQDNQLWVDPLAGLVCRLDPLGGRLFVRLRGDIGGWGVGSKIAWGASASVGYRWLLRRLTVSLALSYEALGADYSSNSGDFGFDAVLRGPAVAVVFGF